MTKAVRVHATGGPEVLTYEDVSVPQPGPGEARIRQTAIGLNFIDVYMRTGLYPQRELPFVLGMEGAGVVEAVGPDTTQVEPGDRVAYCMVPGGYAEERLIRADRLVRLPDDISDEQAAAMMLQGLTAQYLLRTTYPVQPGDTILVHAAAGGVGLIMCQWAKHLGATVIGTVGSDEKAELARAHGCDHPIVYTREDFVARVKEITGGKGLPVVYDGVGKDTFERGLDCLRPRGVMASFGQSSGKVPPLDIALLGAKGSLYVTRAGLASHIASRADLEFRSQDLFEVVRTGAVRIEVRQRYRLSEVKQAHLDLEARRTTGSTVLVP